MPPVLSFTEPPELIGQSPAFLDALAHASAAAPLERPLLIIGERGAGKELLAGRIHFLSARWDGPLIKVNCAALSDELLESELFGHEAGAFTGAQKKRQGRFERAEGGTLFLDEIASASLRVQEKLLRVIEYGEFERLGGEQTQIADVRILAAANADLPALCAQGRFRADLLDRLAFDVIAAPPLRDRPEDIPLLAAHFAAGMAREIGGAFEGFTAEAMAAFVEYPWPGNVRELKNAAERTVYRWRALDREGPIAAVAIDVFPELAPIAPTSGKTSTKRDEVLGPTSEGKSSADMPLPVISETATAAPSYDFYKRLDEIEKTALANALLAHDWRQKKTAGALNLTYDQLRGLIRKHGLKKT